MDLVDQLREEVEVQIYHIRPLEIDEARKIVDLLDAVDEFLKADAQPRQFVFIDEIDKLRQAREKLGGEE
jgi:ATP-dependent protease HslVU (ClpYQ) ATPase subunit